MAGQHGGQVLNFGNVIVVDSYVVYSQMSTSFDGLQLDIAKRVDLEAGIRVLISRSLRVSMLRLSQVDTVWQ